MIFGFAGTVAKPAQASSRPCSRVLLKARAIDH
jgi:hypothetical protein